MTSYDGVIIYDFQFHAIKFTENVPESSLYMQ